MRSFSIIVALDERNGIGKDGNLAWQLSSDLKHFKEITTRVASLDKKNAVIMGRRTWDSLPEKFRPLPQRINIVLSRSYQLKLPQGVLFFSDLNQALSNLNSDQSVDQIFVIGGAMVYAEALMNPACSDLFVTQLKGDFACDTFFPSYADRFQQVFATSWLSEGLIRYRFCHFQKLP